jgi:hypothetical protein
VFIAAITFLPNISLATIEDYTYRHTDLREGFMKYAFEMGSDAMMHIPSFIEIGSAIQKLIGGIHTPTDTQTAWRSRKPTLFQKKESRLETTERRKALERRHKSVQHIVRLHCR